MCASQATDHFLNPIVSETEWNELYQLKNPPHSGKIHQCSIFISF